MNAAKYSLELKGTKEDINDLLSMGSRLVDEGAFGVRLVVRHKPGDLSVRPGRVSKVTAFMSTLEDHK